MWLALSTRWACDDRILDQRFLMLAAWGFMVPFVWGFNAKWLPVFFSAHNRPLLAIGSCGCGSGGRNWVGSRSPVSSASPHSNIAIRIVLARDDLRYGFADHPIKAAIHEEHSRQLPSLCEECQQPLADCGCARIWAANATDPAGIWGASRHALTVGLVAMMVFCIGQRVLPAFSKMRLLLARD